MRWSKSKPEAGPKGPESLKGPRRSGRSKLLETHAAQESGKGLVIKAWPWNVQEGGATPQRSVDGLARRILELWAKTRGKTLQWEENQSTITAHDAEENARRELELGILSVGTAHWLLANEIGEIKRRGLLKGGPHWAMVDDWDELEPETQVWLEKGLTILAKVRRGKGGRVQGEGNQWFETRWVQTCTSQEGAGTWTIKELAKENALVVVQAKKPEWKQYLMARGWQGEIRHAAEVEGRIWKRILIPSVKQGWGSPSQGQNWLDLVASRATGECLVRIEKDKAPAWMPKPQGELGYWEWNPQ
jgi:hypothetical protein